MPDLTFREVAASEIDIALQLLLANDHALADAATVAAFRKDAAGKNLDVNRLWIALEGRRIAWTVFSILNGGRTVTLCGPARRASLANPPAAVPGLIEALCRDLKTRGIELVQAIVETDAVDSRACYVHAGFKPLATLRYLKASISAPSDGWALPPGVELRAYTESGQNELSIALSASYEQTLDCPVLNGLRNIRDVIAGYQAVGAYDPAHWRVVFYRGQPAGALLLTHYQTDRFVELSYIGVAPSLRRQGVGDALVRFAKCLTWQLGGSELSVAADVQNTPALRLYHRHGFVNVTERNLLMRVLTPRESA